MATAPPSLLTELEEELECSMCLETLKDPRVFPQCQHSFCYGCIVNLSLGNSKIFCPECRAEVEVGIPPDLSHFKRNTRINNILECITKLTCNDGTPHLNAEESVTKTSADLQQQPKDAIQIDDRNNPPSVPQTSKNIAEREPVDSFTSTNLQHMTNISLQIGSMVEVISKNKEPKYGVIRWIGYIPYNDKKVAGLELEEELDACTDGRFLGKRYFTCPTKRAFFVYLHNCVLDLRNCEENTANTRLTKPALKDNPSSGATHIQRFEDNGQTQPTFSKQSPDEAIKGQGYNEKRHLEKSRGAIGTSFDGKWKESKNENQSKLKLCKDNPLENQKKTSRKDQKDALFTSTFYILLKDECAKKQGKDYSYYSYSNLGMKCLFKGEIMIRNRTTVVDSTNETLRLHPYDKMSYFCDCPLGEIMPLGDEEAKLLLSIKSYGDRYKFYMDSTVDTGKKMTIGSNVYVKVRLPSGGGGTQELRGIIRYKGPLPKEDGTLFGVELLEGRGRGTTDGLFRGQRYFQCDPECGIFVPLEKLRLCEATKESMLTKVKNKIVEGISSLISSEETDQENSLEKQKNTAGHQVGDRVWVFIHEKLRGGFIRYIGRVPRGRGLHIGIELDNPDGLGDGVYYGKQLFSCPLDHAHFNVIDNVISREKFHELYGK